MFTKLSLATLVCAISLRSTAWAFTDTPDLIQVHNVRPGSNLRAQTLVDYTFDESTSIKECCNLFKVVPADGSDPIEASDVMDKTMVKTTFTIVFPGALSASDLARGIIEANVVRSETSFLLNPPQAASVDGGASETVNPDLVSVTVDGDSDDFSI